MGGCGSVTKRVAMRRFGGPDFGLMGGLRHIIVIACYICGGREGR